MNPLPRIFRPFAMLGTLFGCLLLSQTATAILIDFDDLTDGTAVTTQYKHLGLIIENGVITDTTHYEDIDPAVSGPNALHDLNGPGLSLHFVGKLPTFVGMFVTAAQGDQIGIAAFGPRGGVVGARLLDGWAGQDDDPPAVPRQWVAFAGGQIARIDLAAFYDRRGDIHIDDLTFGPRNSVPEPTTWLLLAIGLALLAWNRRNQPG